MKLAITTQGPELNSPIELRFGRAPFFRIVDTETGQQTPVDNASGVNAVQGAGTQAVQTLARLGVQAVLTGHVGPKAWSALQASTRMLVVTEPTPSGEHDLERVLALGRYFGIPAWVSVNKHDLNPAMTARLESRAVELGARAKVAARIPYDPAVTTAQRQGRPVVELDHGPAATAMAQLWKNLWNSSPLIFTNPLSDQSPPSLRLLSLLRVEEDALAAHGFSRRIAGQDLHHSVPHPNHRFEVGDNQAVREAFYNRLPIQVHRWWRSLSGFPLFVEWGGRNPHRGSDTRP